MSNTSSSNQTERVDDCLAIGSIISSNSHLDYTVEIYNKTDRERAPAPDECGFGQPVFIKKTIQETEYIVMGVIYDTRLVDPDQGRSGPRLAQQDQPQFTPGYVEERTKLAGVALLGTAKITDGGTIEEPDHQMPRWTLAVEDIVERCPDGVIRAFHTTTDGGIQLAYMERLLDVAGPLGAEVTLTLVERLSQLFPAEEHQRLLDIIEKDVRWQSSVDRGVMR
ncbi:hypothetical protein halTADL_1456 [Halohasta litchfieldiae]|jgi:hypothetical protein|uniref:DUF8166 domain-containing protein n=1 Tax=Halohasta litchfieldiae TaxID=1073996 RepID=A0A1H6W5P1_9EURY|nr:hypothetical protein [Halohasta litchfieldiae]ATW88222.1 hypothetical protein halTADL_1456 [Halohasta litchfieldiae]SEJ07605.1 hypothetical protein SAMN05444271_11959 [Halohasta litchfieldiae]